MSIKFHDTIRGVEVEITAMDFDGDESVGISYGPEVVFAKRIDDGTDFELTDAESEKAGITATEIYYDDIPDYP